jgi:CO/xanthine dehydrogenase FAD-binding subunit
VELFNFQTPSSIAELLVAKANTNAWLLAGGTDLIPQLKEGRRKADLIIDTKKIPAMNGIGLLDDGTLRIGAAVSATTIAQNENVGRSYSALALSVALIGSRQVQNRATLGGNVCNAAPSADAIPALICYEAIAEIEGAEGKRQILVEDLFTGPGRTQIDPTEVLISFLLPVQTERSAAAYQRFTPRREMDIAVAGVGSRITLNTDGKIIAARVALASVGPTPLRAPSAEDVLMGESPSTHLFEEASIAAARDASPISDTRGSADYRKHLVSVLCKRTLASATNELLQDTWT